MVYVSLPRRSATAATTRRFMMSPAIPASRLTSATR